MSDNRPNTAYSYCRVSTDKQAKEGFSLGQQKKSCQILAKSHSIKILDYYIDKGETATASNRKQFMQMLEDCERKEVKYILVYHSDRFARNSLDHLVIKDRLSKLGISLLSVTQPMIDSSPEGKLLDTMMASINQFYSDDLSRKTMRGMYGRWEKGWWVSGAPHGYMNVNKEHKITKTSFTVEKQKYLESLGRQIMPIEQDPFVAPYIKQAFELYATNNYSYFNLGQYLFEKGLKTANGKPLAHSTIHQIITNPFYYGKMRWNNEERMGKHEPLIDEALFKHCQLIAAQKRHFIIRQRKHDFLLRGVVFCNRCGLRYTAEWHKLNSVSADKIAYYHCAKRQPCKSPYIEMEELESLVEKQLHKVKFTDEFIKLLSDKVKEYLENQGSRNNEAEQILVKRRAELKKQKSELLSYLVNKVIDKDDFAEKKAEIEAEIEGINEEVGKLDRTSNFDFDLLEEVLKLTMDIPATYNEAPPELKRQYLKFFYNKVKVDNKKIIEVEFSDLLLELISFKRLIIISTRLPD